MSDLSGETVTCPACNYTTQRFDPNEELRCPECGEEERLWPQHVAAAIMEDRATRGAGLGLEPQQALVTYRNPDGSFSRYKGRVERITDQRSAKGLRVRRLLGDEDGADGILTLELDVSQRVLRVRD